MRKGKPFKGSLPQKSNAPQNESPQPKDSKADTTKKDSSDIYAPLDAGYGMMTELDPHEQRLMVTHRLRITLVIVLLIAVLLVVILLVGPTAITRIKSYNDSSNQSEKLIAEYQQMLAEKSQELGVELVMTKPHMDALRNGTSTPEELLQEAIASAPTPDPSRISGKTLDEVKAEYYGHMDECIETYAGNIDQIIEEASGEVETVRNSTNPDDRKNFINKYKTRINTTEKLVQSSFNEYMVNMRDDLEKVDGSYDAADREIIDSFKAEFNDRCDAEWERFLESTGLKSSN